MRREILFWIKYSSSWLLSIGRQKRYSSGNTTEDGSRIEDVRKAKVFETCWILDLVKIQLLGQREPCKEKNWSWSSHNSIWNTYFLHFFTQLVLQFYAFEDSKLRWSPLFHLRPWKDHLRSFRCNLQDFSLSLPFCSENEKRYWTSSSTCLRRYQEK